MLRWLVLFVILLVLGNLFWLPLREVGIAWLPGDITLKFYGYSVHAPVTTAFLTSAALAAVWRLLER